MLTLDWPPGHLTLPLVAGCSEDHWDSVLLPILYRTLFVLLRVSLAARQWLGSLGIGCSSSFPPPPPLLLLQKVKAGWETIEARTQSTNDTAVAVWVEP